MSNLLSEIEEVLEDDIVDRHSFFQLKHFVVGKEYTNQGKMWLCLREIRARKSFIEQYIVEIEELNDRIGLLHIEKERVSLALVKMLLNERDEKLRNLAVRETDIKGRQFERQIDSLKKSLVSFKQKIIDYEQEAAFYLSEFKQLTDIEELKPLDDLESQKEYWSAKLFQEINLKVLLQQPLDLETVKMILSLHDDSELKKQMVNLLGANQRLMNERKNAQLPTNQQS